MKLICLIKLFRLPGLPLFKSGRRVLPAGPSVATEGCFRRRPPAADHPVSSNVAVNYSIFARSLIFDVFRVFGPKVGQHGRRDGPR